MQPNAVLILLRWIQWFLSLIIFGTAFAFFLLDVNDYIFIPVTLKAQVGLAGFLHIYMYLSAIWTSCMGGLSYFWTGGDILFAAITLAIAGLTQPQTSTYCVSQLTWAWNRDLLAYVPPSIHSTDPDSTMTFTSMFLRLQCAFFATIAAVAGVLVILFVVSLFLQFRYYQHERREVYSQLPSSNEMNISAPVMRGFRQSIARGARESFAPLASPLKLPRQDLPRPPPVPPLPTLPREGRVQDV